MKITSIEQLVALTAEPKDKRKIFYLAEYRYKQVVGVFIFVAEHPRHPGEAIFNDTSNHATFKVISENKLNDAHTFLSDDYKEAAAKAILFAEKELESIREIYTKNI